jgi:hypothetical protein
MASERRQRRRQRRGLGRLTAPKPAVVAASATPAPAAVATPKRRQEPCERCGAGCRSAKYPYGWVCKVCADELDRYYVIMSGMVGGTHEGAYLADKRKGTVPDLSAPARRERRARSS